MTRIKNLTRAEIDLNILENNLDEIRKHLPAEKPMLCVIKANAYGHGAVEVSKCLERKGVRLFAVACLKEAVELREAGMSSQIIIFGGLTSEEVRDSLAYDVTPVIYTKDIAEKLNREAEIFGKKIKVHVEIDTGMGRLGILPDEVNSFFPFLKTLKNIDVEGLMMHFAEADIDDDNYTIHQMSLFEDCRKKIISIINGVNPHAANSAAFLKYPDSLYSSPRIGLMLYGYKPCKDELMDISLKPVMTLKSRITFIKEVKKDTFISYGRTYKCPGKMKIATIGCGYADGLNRKLSNNFSVLIHGKLAPLVGRVCMDQTMIDITQIDGVDIGDEVVLMGIQRDKYIGADEIAERIETIPYEILCAVGQRVDRIYTKK